MTGYHSAQVDVPVRLNTNESPFSPPQQWLDSLTQIVQGIDWNRYPDRGAHELRKTIANTLAMLATAGVPILKALQAAADTGYALTFGLQTRLDSTVAQQAGLHLASSRLEPRRQPRHFGFYSRSLAGTARGTPRRIACAALTARLTCFEN